GLLVDVVFGEVEAGDQIVGQVVGDGVRYSGQRGRNRRPVVVSRDEVEGTLGELSRVVRIYLVNINFAEQGVGKIQRAPLTGADIVVVVPVELRMRVGVADDVEGFVGVDARRNDSAILTAGYGDAERRLRRAGSAGQWWGQHRVGGRRGNVAVVGNQAGASRRRDRNSVDKVGTDIAVAFGGGGAPSA